MSNLPETFAGGTFNLPVKVAKIVRLAASSEPERTACNEKLKKYGYFVDRVGICWELGRVPDIAKDGESNKEK